MPPKYITCCMTLFTSIPILLLLAAAGGNGVHCLQDGISRRALQQRRHHLRSRAVSGATVLELKHHSFSAGPSKTREEEVDGILSSDAARVSLLQRRIENYRLIKSSPEAAAATASKAQVPVTSGAKLSTLNYIATIGLGSGEATVIVDTASELTWVQCKPCESCHYQEEPLFDPSSSPSYAAVPCNSSSCGALQVATGMSGTACGADQPACSYTLSYRDGSYSHGVRHEGRHCLSIPRHLRKTALKRIFKRTVQECAAQHTDQIMSQRKLQK